MSTNNIDMDKIYETLTKEFGKIKKDHGNEVAQVGCLFAAQKVARTLFSYINDKKELNRFKGALIGGIESVFLVRQEQINKELSHADL